jgi:hypothetical protein
VGQRNPSDPIPTTQVGVGTTNQQGEFAIPIPSSD